MEGTEKKYNSSLNPKKLRKEKNRRNRTDRNHKMIWET